MGYLLVGVRQARVLYRTINNQGQVCVSTCSFPYLLQISKDDPTEKEQKTVWGYLFIQTEGLKHLINDHRLSLILLWE